MKIKAAVLSCLAILSAILLPRVAQADSISFSLANPIQSVTTTGGELSYSGTITALATNTGFEYLNSDSYSFSGPGVLDDSAYLLNAPVFLTPGQSYTGLLFIVPISANAVGTFPGLFSIVGGGDSSSLDTLATASFQVNVAAPTAAVTPEPASLVLLATGMLGAFAVVRRRASQVSYKPDLLPTA